MENLQSQIEKRIDQMVGDVLVLIRKAASDAVNNALNGTDIKMSVRSTKARRKPTTKTLRTPSRTKEEIQHIAHTLYMHIEDNPGEKIAVYGNTMGMDTRELDRPMRNLKKEGRVKSAGGRHDMRYFPMGTS